MIMQAAFVGWTQGPLEADINRNLSFVHAASLNWRIENLSVRV
jgi:hypothetical protein